MLEILELPILCFRQQIIFLANFIEGDNARFFIFFNSCHLPSPSSLGWILNCSTLWLQDKDSSITFCCIGTKGTMEASSLHVPGEASNFDEVSMQQSLFFSDSLKVLLFVCLLYWLFFRFGSQVTYSVPWKFNSWFLCLIQKIFEIIIDRRWTLFGIVSLSLKRTFVTSALLNCASMAVLLHFLCLQDLKNLRTQLYSAAEFFEMSYTNDSQRQMWVILIYHNIMFFSTFACLIVVFIRLHKMLCISNLGYIPNMVWYYS